MIMTESQITEARNQIASFIKTQREASGITPQQLADKCECKQSTIWRIEKGFFLPNTTLLIKIIDALGCHLYFMKKPGS